MTYGLCFLEKILVDKVIQSEKKYDYKSNNLYLDSIIFL